MIPEAAPKLEGTFTPCTFQCGQPEPCWGCDSGDYTPISHGTTPGEVMTINNEAVEAAAEAIYGLGVPDLPWNERDDELRELYREDARTAIEAAAPHMLTSMARSLGEPTEEVIQLRGAVAAVLRLLEIHESKGNPTIHTHELSDVLRGSL